MKKPKTVCHLLRVSVDRPRLSYVFGGKNQSFVALIGPHTIPKLSQSPVSRVFGVSVPKCGDSDWPRHVLAQSEPQRKMKNPEVSERLSWISMGSILLPHPGLDTRKCIVFRKKTLTLSEQGVSHLHTHSVTCTQQQTMLVW